MLRSNSRLFRCFCGSLALAAGLAASTLFAQQPNYSTAPADLRPSLNAPPIAPSWQDATQWQSASPGEPTPVDNPQNYQTNQPSYQWSEPGGLTPNSTAAPLSSSCAPCQTAPVASYQPQRLQPVPQQAPQTLLSPVVLPPAAYSSTYVPPPPRSAYYGNTAAYPQLVGYRQAYSNPQVYARPVAPVVTATPQNYYLQPLIPVQNVPAGATIGRGLLGQPTVYVPGQPVRNFLRYLAP